LFNFEPKAGWGLSFDGYLFGGVLFLFFIYNASKKFIDTDLERLWVFKSPFLGNFNFSSLNLKDELKVSLNLGAYSLIVELVLLLMWFSLSIIL
jgi:hypothetical protein